MNLNQSGIYPRFFTEAVENKAKSREAGRPIFVEKEFVEILIAGDSKTKVVRKVSEEHKHRWPQEYERFQQQEDQPLEGTPIDEWGALSKSRAAEFKALNILTVEGLAQLNDNAITRLGMGGREWVEKAKAYVEFARESAVVEKYAAENAQLRADVDMLKEQIKELSQKKSPGRPKKQPEAEAE